MNREALIAEARGFDPFPPGAAAAFEDCRDRLVWWVDERLLVHPELARLIGGHATDRMRENHAHHGRFMATLLRRFDAVVLVDTVLWVLSAYGSRGYRCDYWTVQLGAWQEAIEAQLPGPAASALQDLYGWLIRRLPVLWAIARDEVSDDGLFP
jgi:hypothetical protein